MNTTTLEKPITPSQRRVLECIALFRAEHGYCPSVRELQQLLGFASPTAVHGHIWALRRRGRVTWEIGKDRTLREVPHG